MVKNFALPVAVAYKDRQALHGLDTPTLRRLIDDCESWFAGTLDLGAALNTVAAKTEWRALIREDASNVCAAHARLREEVNARQSRSNRLRKEVKAWKFNSKERAEPVRKAAE